MGLRRIPTFGSIALTMSYTGHADAGMEAEVEALRQSVFEIEHAPGLPDRHTPGHVLVIAILSLVLFCTAVLLILL